MPPVVILGDDEPPPPTGDVSGTLEIESEPAGGNYIAHAMLPLSTPVAPAALPSVQVAGVTAQLNVNKRTATGEAEVVELVAYVPSGGSYAVADGPGSAPPVTVPDPDLSAVKLTAKIANVATRVEAPLVTLNKETRHTGPLHEYEVYWSRFSNGTDTLLGVHWYLQRFAGTDVALLALKVINGICDPAAGEPSGQITDPNQYYDLPNETMDGRVYFDDIQIEIPAGWSIVSVAERPSEDLSGSPRYVVAPRANSSEQHFLPPRAGFVRRYAICPAGDEAEALEMLEMRGWGRVTGQNSLHTLGGWGPTSAALPDATSDYTSGGMTGRAAARDKLAGDLASIEAVLTSGGANSGVQVYQGELGWFHAFGQMTGQTSGGTLIDSFAGGQANGSMEELRLYRHIMDMTYDRHQVACVHPIDGKQVTTHDIVAANAVNPGDLPWNDSASVSGVAVYQMPWWIDPDAWVNGPSNFPRLLPTDRVWNAPDAGKTCPYEFVVNPQESQTSGSHYSRFDGQHGIRFTRSAQACAANFNDEVAKDLLKADALYRQIGMSQYTPAVQFSNGGSGMPDSLAAADGTGGFGRREGWQALAVAAAYAYADDAYRAPDFAWAQLFADLCAAQATPGTSSQVVFGANNGSPQANSEGSWGPTDLVNGWGAVPDDADAGQVYEMMIVSHGMYAVTQSMLGAADRKRDASMRGLVADAMEALFAVDLQLPNSQYVYQRGNPDRNVPQIFVVHHLGDDVYPGTFVPWAFGQNAFGRLTNDQRFVGLAMAWRASGGAQLWVDLAHEAYDVFDSDTNEAISRAMGSLLGSISGNQGFQQSDLIALLQGAQA